MKAATPKHARWSGKLRALILFGAVMAIAAGIACSTESTKAPKTSASSAASPRLETVASTTAPAAPVPAVDTPSAAKPFSTPPKLIEYRSRDYGVSFQYPWQYAFLSAKAVATGDPARRPKADGQDGQITLARIEIPRGFYPDTDFESGYFTLSLNQDLDEQQCLAAVAATDGVEAGTQTINGIEFRWIKTESGGRGSTAMVRNYAAFSNATCYELEMGVTTRNDQGLAREVDPDQVFRRLEAIVGTVKILPAKNASREVATRN